MSEEYKFSVQVGDKTVKYRKWKVKDKKTFIESMKAGDLFGVEKIVFDCVQDKNQPLSQEEYRYVLMHIRGDSLGENLPFIIKCGECGERFPNTTSVKEIYTPRFGKYGTIKSGNTSFKMGEIQNKEYYIDAIHQCNTFEEQSFIDFLYHVREHNGNNGFTFQTLYDAVNDLDVDVASDIFKQWEDMRFTYDDHIIETCPHCKTEQQVKVDTLYGFFPKDWFSK